MPQTLDASPRLLLSRTESFRASQLQSSRQATPPGSQHQQEAGTPPQRWPSSLVRVASPSLDLPSPLPQEQQQPAPLGRPIRAQALSLDIPDKKAGSSRGKEERGGQLEGGSRRAAAAAAAAAVAHGGPTLSAALQQACRQQGREPEGLQQALLASSGVAEAGDAQQIQRYSRLHTLDLSDSHLASMAALEPLAALTALDLSAAPLAQLQDLRPGAFQQLQALSLSYCSVPAEQLLGRSSPLAGLASLRSLQLAGMGLRELPAQLGPFAALQLLDLSGNLLRAGALQGLAALPELAQLVLAHNAVACWPTRQLQQEQEQEQQQGLVFEVAASPELPGPASTPMPATCGAEAAAGPQHPGTPCAAAQRPGSAASSSAAEEPGRLQEWPDPATPASQLWFPRLQQLDLSHNQVSQAAALQGLQLCPALQQVDLTGNPLLLLLLLPHRQQRHSGGSSRQAGHSTYPLRASRRPGAAAATAGSGAAGGAGALLQQLQLQLQFSFRLVASAGPAEEQQEAPGASGTGGVHRALVTVPEPPRAADTLREAVLLAAGGAVQAADLESAFEKASLCRRLLAPWRWSGSACLLC